VRFATYLKTPAEYNSPDNGGRLTLGVQNLATCPIASDFDYLKLSTYPEYNSGFISED